MTQNDYETLICIDRSVISHQAEVKAELLDEPLIRALC